MGYIYYVGYITYIHMTIAMGVRATLDPHIPIHNY